MACSLPPLALENGLNLRDVLTTGSVLQFNEMYEDTNGTFEENSGESKVFNYIGEPVQSLEEINKLMVDVDDSGYVRKRILEIGGGMELNEGCTVSIAYSAFWEKEDEPFDARKVEKPLVVNLKDNGLLPGLQIAVKSMLVGEMSVFLFSYRVMYGEVGVPPRIKAKADCIFYIKLIKSIITPKDGELDLSEPNGFHRVHHEVKLIYSSGVTLYKLKNYQGAIKLFVKGINMLHRCRLANEKEELIQEKLLVKMYTNLAVCYNSIKQPLKTCTACNELNRLQSLWNNGKVLFHNAKALRMIGDFNMAEKKLMRAKTLCPDNRDIIAEMELLRNARESCDQNKLFVKKFADASFELVSDSFKHEVDNLVKNFKQNVNLCKLTLPIGLNTDEMSYIKCVCIRENLFFNKIQKNFLLDKEAFPPETSTEELLCDMKL